MTPISLTPTSFVYMCFSPMTPIPPHPLSSGTRLIRLSPSPSRPGACIWVGHNVSGSAAGEIRGLRKLTNSGGLTHYIDHQDVTPGLHIYVYRGLYTYSQHGIAGGFESDPERTLWVYHFRGDIEEFCCKPCRKRRDGTSCALVHHNHLYPNSAVVRSCVHCFGNGHSLHYHRYGVARHEFLSSRKGSCHMGRCEDGESVLRRAEDAFLNGFGDYRLFERNCEQFALYCSTGKERLRSKQIEMLERIAYKLRSSQQIWHGMVR